MNMTGITTQGTTMGNTMGMMGVLGFGNSGAAIPMSPGVDPTRNEAGTGLVQRYVRIEKQRMPPGMPLYPSQMMPPMNGGNQYITGGNLASMQMPYGAGNMGGLMAIPMGKFSDPMTRKKVI